MKARDKAKEHPQEMKNPRFKEANLKKKEERQGVRAWDDSGERLQSLKGEDRIKLKLKTKEPSAGYGEEKKKTGTILDRLVKPGDRLKRSLPETKQVVENKLEKIEKKVKPDPISSV